MMGSSGNQCSEWHGHSESGQLGICGDPRFGNIIQKRSKASGLNCLGSKQLPLPAIKVTLGASSLWVSVPLYGVTWNEDTSNFSLTSLLGGWSEIVWGGHRVDAQQSVAAITETRLPGDSDVQPNWELWERCSIMSLHSELHKVTFHHLHMTSGPQGCTKYVWPIDATL